MNIKNENLKFQFHAIEEMNFNDFNSNFNDLNREDSFYYLFSNRYIITLLNENHYN